MKKILEMLSESVNMGLKISSSAKKKIWAP